MKKKKILKNSIIYGPVDLHLQAKRKMLKSKLPPPIPVAKRRVRLNSSRRLLPMFLPFA